MNDRRAANAIPGLFPAPTKHGRLIDWVADIAALTPGVQIGGAGHAKRQR